MTTLDQAVGEVSRRIDTAERIGVAESSKLNVTFGALRTLANALRDALRDLGEAREAVRRQAAAVRALDGSRAAQDEAYRRIALSAVGVDRAELLDLLAATRDEARRWNARATDLEDELARAMAATEPARDIGAMRNDYARGREAGMAARLALGEVLADEPRDTPALPSGAHANWGLGWRRGWQEMSHACERDFYRAELARRGAR